MTLDFGRYLLPEMPPDNDTCSGLTDFLQQCTFEPVLGELVLRRPVFGQREDTCESLLRRQLEESRRRRGSDSGYTSPTDNGGLPNGNAKHEKNQTNSRIKATFVCGSPPDEDTLREESDDTEEEDAAVAAAPYHRQRRVTFADEKGLQLVTQQTISNSQDRADEHFNGEASFFQTSIFDSHRLNIHEETERQKILSPPPSPPSPTLSPSSISSDEEDSSTMPSGIFTPVPPKEKNIHINDTICRLCFVQPGASFDTFRTRLDNLSVSLENVRVEDITVFGTVKVKNLGFVKRVFIRCTYDGWLSHVNIPATHVAPGSINPVYDTFSFAVLSPPLSTLSKRGPRAAEFAVCFEVNGQAYWDNNDGQNYKISWRQS